MSVPLEGDSQFKWGVIRLNEGGTLFFDGGFDDGNDDDDDDDDNDDVKEDEEEEETKGSEEVVGEDGREADEEGLSYILPCGICTLLFADPIKEL